LALFYLAKIVYYSLASLSDKTCSRKRERLSASGDASGRARFFRFCLYVFLIVRETMMFKVVTKKLLAGVAFATLSCMVAAPASASAIMIDFEGVGSGCRVENFYNGGSDSCGNVGGVNLGVAFGDYSLALLDADTGLGSGNFANEPSPETILFFLNGSAILNYEPGFTDGFSFYYSASFAATVSVWSGLDGTGDLLGEIALGKNYQNGNCKGDPSGDYCHWDVGFLAFADTAKSINFAGTANYVGFDNITFGSINPNQPPTNPTNPDVPEPGVALLLGAGLVGLTISSRRRKA
jgi:hypothetical protein